MDLKNHFRKIREVEANLSQGDPVLKSLATSNGGKAGVLIQTPRAVAARMIVEGSAVIATDEEAVAYFEQQEAARKRTQEQDYAKNLLLALASDSELRLSTQSKAGKTTPVK